VDKLLSVAILIVCIVASTMVVAGQDGDPICSDEFITIQIDLMSDTETYFAYDDNGLLLDEDGMIALAERELATYCDPDYSPMFDVGIDIPIESWFIATDIMPDAESDSSCFDGYIGQVIGNDDGTDDLSEITTACQSVIDPSDDNRDVLFLSRGLTQNIPYLSNEYGEDFDCVIGYYYTVHVQGTSIDIHGFCDIDEDGNITLSTRLDEDTNSRVIVRYLDGFGFDLMPLTNDQLMTFGLPITPYWLHPFTTDELDALRAIPELDPIRYPGFPDDIEFYLLSNDRANVDTEIVFGRLEQRLDEPNRFVVELLNQPFTEHGVNLGDLLVVELTTIDELPAAVYVEPYMP